MNLTALWDVSNQFNHKNGSILAGGKIYVFYEGRSQLATTYVDGAGQVVNPNPILLDNNGRATCFADDAYSYTCVVCDFYGKEQFSFNPVGLGGQSSTAITKYNITSDSLNVTSAYDASTNTKTFDIEIQNTNPQHWYGMYGETIQHDGSDTEIPLPIPTNISYEGDFIERIVEGKYIYLKEGIYLVDCVIRFEQDPEHLDNKIEEVLVNTGNGNDEDQNFILDETGRYSYTADYRKCIKQSFVRIVKEGDTYSSNLLYFAPDFPVPCSEMYIQNLSIVKLESYVGSGGSTSGEVYKAGEHIVIDPYNVISTSGLVTPTQLETALNNYVTEQTFNTNIQNINSALSGKQDSLSFMYNTSGEIIGINNSAIAGGTAGEVYQGGEGIRIEGNVISVSGSYLQTSAYTAPVQSDWNQTNTSSLDYILNKPNTEEVQFEELDLTGLASQQYVDEHIVSATSGLQPAGDYVKQDDLSAYVTNNTFNTTINNIEADVSGKLDTSAYTAPVNADWNSSTGLSEILNKPSTEEVQFEELDLSSYATQEYVDSATSGKLDSSAYVAPVNADWSATSGLSQILNKPNTEEVQFEELDLSDYATKDYVDSATSGIAQYTEGNHIEITDQNQINVTGIGTLSAGPNVEIYQVNGGYAISAAPGGSSYSEGDYISIDDNVISVIGLQPVSGMSAYVQNSAYVAPVQSDWTEDDNTDLSYIKNKPVEIGLIAGSGIYFEDLTSGVRINCSATGGGGGATYTAGTGIAIQNNVISVSGSYLQTSAYVAPVNADWNSSTGLSEILNKPNTEEVTFEELDLTDFVQQNDLSGYASKSDLGNYQPTSGMSAYQTVAGMSSYQTVAGMSSYAQKTDLNGKLDTSAYVAPVNADWDSSSGLSEILNKPSTEAVSFEELDLSSYASKTDLGNYQPTSGMSAYQTVAGMSTYATDNELAAAVSGKQNKITAFNDSVLVNALPASPVSTTLYLIPEA